MRTGTAVTALAMLLLAGQACAEEKPGRFAMQPTEGGFLRLDSQTGAVAFCNRRNADWQCAPVVDDTLALRQENDKLKARNAELEAELKRLEELVGPRDKDKDGQGKQAERPAVPGVPGMQLPNEQDVDRALDYLSRMLRKFRDKFKELDEPDGQGKKI